MEEDRKREEWSERERERERENGNSGGLHHTAVGRKEPCYANH